MPYFVIFNDDYNREKMEIVILDLYKPNYKAYLFKNFEYFLGKIMTI